MYNFEQTAFAPGVNISSVRWLMAWLKVFARLIKKTTTATGHEVKVCEGYYAYPFSQEHEPQRREQTVLATRSWRDPSKEAPQVREC